MSLHSIFNSIWNFDFSPAFSILKSLLIALVSFFVLLVVAYKLAEMFSLEKRLIKLHPGLQKVLGYIFVAIFLYVYFLFLSYLDS